MFKRGLSSVITTVLLILLALSAAVILGAFLNLTISSLKDTNLKSSTTEVNINKKSVNFDDKNLSFIVSSPSSDNVTGVYVVLKDSEGKTDSYSQRGISLGEFTTSKLSFDISKSGLENVQEVCVYPIFLINGKESIGETGNCYDTESYGITGPFHGFNMLPHGDEIYLLNNITVSIFKDLNNNPSFSIKRNGEFLRVPSQRESFYLNNGSVRINYTIEEKTSGVDIVYQISNPTSTSQALPDMRITGIRQTADPSLNFLWKKDYGNLVPVYNSDMTLRRYEYGSWNDTYIRYNNLLGFSSALSFSYYPGLYSPVILSADSNYAVGSSFQYPYLEYKTSLSVKLFQNSTNPNEWMHEYVPLTDRTTARATLPPGESRTYTISLRYAQREHWITALYPYKLYFQSLYESNASRPPMDRRPIGYYQPGMASVTPDNPRGFVNNPTTRLDLNGWRNYTNDILAYSKKWGVQRVEIWTASGLYKNGSHNFPPQFMDWTPKQLESQSEFDKFTQNGIDYGFWWGRSAQVPYYSSGYDPATSWEPLEPPYLESFNYSNPVHLAFFNSQIDRAVQRGAKIVGLDAFSFHDYEKYYFIDYMESRAPGVLFSNEGSDSDFIHSKIGNVYWPEINAPGRWIYGQDMLACYLNPNSDLQIFMRHGLSKKSGYLPENQANARVPNQADFQNLVNWGYAAIDGVGNINNTLLQYPPMGCPI